MRPRIRPLHPHCYLALALTPACQLPQAGSSQFTTTVVALTSVSATTGEDPDTTTEDSAGSSSTGALSTGDASAGAASGDTGGTTLILDVGVEHDLGEGIPVGCRGKIDFLFVISRYAGMSGFQTQLRDGFPKFIDTIEAKFADFDYHIMVIDGDPTWGVITCDQKCPIPCLPGYPCDYTQTYCDKKLGAGTVYPTGDDASNKPCDIDVDLRYMVTGQPNLKETFACVAQVGSSGGDWMGEALTAAMHSNINDPGGCNPGFLRDDALLMVTLISNTYDQEGKPWGSTGTPETWAAAVRKAKGEDLKSVVMLSILDASQPDCHPEDRTCQMLELFPYSLRADRFSDYSVAFDKATDLVETACDDFIPQR